MIHPCEILARFEEVVKCHPLVESFDDHGDWDGLVGGRKTSVLVVRGDTIHVIYVPTHKTQFLFDAYGEDD